MNPLALSAAAAILASSAAAQSAPQVHAASTPIPIAGQPKDAGTYHLATGTWTRATGTVAGFGLSNNIYSNTATVSYYTSDIGPGGFGAFGKIIDDGAIPGQTNPAVFANGGAVTDFFTVTEVRIGYCDNDPAAAVAGWTIDFFEDHAPCSNPTQVPVGTVTVSGLPSNGCWFATLDLTSASGTGEEFSIQADGGAASPGYNGPRQLDSMGISWRYTGTGSGPAGPIIAGDPASTDTGWTGGWPTAGSNTYFGETGLCPGVGTGYFNFDEYWIEDTFVAGGVDDSMCYFFNGYRNNAPGCNSVPSRQYGGFYMEMGAEWEKDPDCGICTISCTGAVTSTGSPATCTLSGDAVAANNDARITARGVPANQFGLFLTGRVPLPAMTFNSGNGWLCINPSLFGGLGRFQGPSQIKNSGPLGEFSLDTGAGEWSLASIPTATGSYAAMQGITSHFQAWFRDPVGSGFNFSSSASVTWQ